MSNITIVGAGMMGSALAFPARENGHRVRLTGTHLDREIIAESKRTGKHPKFDKPFPAGVEYFYFEELAEALEGADMVICGVNSFGVDWFMQEVLPHIPDTTPVLSVTKGLVAYDDGTLISYPEYWERSIAPRKMNLNAVGGPCTSYELVAHDQTIVTFCGRDMQTLETLRGLMRTDYYHIHLSTEVMGVESAVALKNAYALGVALAVGLNEKVNGGLYAALQFAGGDVLPERQGDPQAAHLPHGQRPADRFGGRRHVRHHLRRPHAPDRHPAGARIRHRRGAGRTERRDAGIARHHRPDQQSRQKLAQDGKLDAAEFPLLMHMDAIIEGKATSEEIPWERFTN